jgi:hypothetical protein
MIVAFYLYFQFCALPQLKATRTISGHSVPIISCIAAGAGAIIRIFAPESIGGIGDFGAKIDAEVARTGLSDDEIGPKVHILHHASRWTKLSCIQRYYTIQKGKSFGFLAFL